MSFKDFFFYFKLWWPFCSVKRNHINNFRKGSYETLVKGHKRNVFFFFFFFFVNFEIGPLDKDKSNTM